MQPSLKMNNYDFSYIHFFSSLQGVVIAALKTVMRPGLDREGRNSGRRQLIQMNCVAQVKHGGELEVMHVTTSTTAISLSR